MSLFNYPRSVIYKRQLLLFNCSHDIFQDPVSLTTCGHVFCRYVSLLSSLWPSPTPYICRACVIATLEGPGITRSQCPTCHVPGWKNNLATNHLIKGLTEQFCSLIELLPGPQCNTKERVKRLMADEEVREQPDSVHPLPKRRKLDMAPSQHEQQEEKQAAQEEEPPFTPYQSLAPCPEDFDVDIYIRELKALPLPEEDEVDYIRGEIAALEQALLLCDLLPCQQEGTQSASLHHAQRPSQQQGIADLKEPSIIPETEEQSATVEETLEKSTNPPEKEIHVAETQVVSQTQISNPVTNLDHTGHLRRLVISGGASGVHKRFLELQKILGSQLLELDESVTVQTTHVLVDTEVGLAKGRTAKFLGGLALGCWLVSYAWLDACIETRDLVPEAPFEVKGLEQLMYEKVSRGVPAASRLRRIEGRPGIFDGITVYIGKGSSKAKSDLRQPIPALIELAGGSVVKSLTGSGPARIVALERDVALRLKKTYPAKDVISSKWILDSITQGILLPITKYIDWS